MATMGEIERLARDICWAEFSTKPKDTTKAVYWQSIHPEAREEYRQDAEWVVYIAKKLKPLRILALVDFRSKGKPVRGIKRASSK